MGGNPLDGLKKHLPKPSPIIIRLPKPPPPPPIRIPNPLKEFEKILKDATSKLGKTAESGVGKVLQKGADGLTQIKNEGVNLADTITNEIERTVQDVAREAERAKSDVQKTADQLKEQVQEEANRAVEDMKREASRAKGKLDGKLTTLRTNIEKEAQRAKDNIDKEATRIKQDIDTQATRLQEDINREVTNAREDVEEATKAAETFVTSQMESFQDTVEETGALLSEGKVLDALAHAATEPLKDAKGSYVAAVSESQLLAQAASLAVSAYGGPAAGAAYSAWLTYEMTGDLQGAIQAGVLSAVIAEGGEIVNGMPTKTLSDEMLREVTRSSINAAAVAVSGGTKADIERAFMTSAVNAAQSRAQAALQTWVQMEVAPKLGVVDAPDMEELSNSSLVGKAKSLYAEVEAFEAKYAHLVRAGLQAEEFIRQQADEAVTDAITDVVTDTTEGE